MHEKNISKQMSKTNILLNTNIAYCQVDNLYQLLPQDRVQDFSRMNPQQLLRSTLLAVGGNESVPQLDELIQTRNEQRNITATQENNSQLLQEQIRLNERY